MADFDVIVVGAGVIGLALARHLATEGRDVLVLEAESAIGQHTSSRNSGVIHAGIYYEKGSDQQVLCLDGKAMLYDYCATRHVPFERCGKLTLAPTSGDSSTLEALMARGHANGVSDLYMMSEAEVLECEPAVKSAGAMMSPSSGIVDAPALMLSLLGEFEAAGGALALNAPFRSARRENGLFHVGVGDAEGTWVTCRSLFNCAALGAWDVARGIAEMPADLIPSRNLAKGSYFSIAGKSPFQALIYPMPRVGSLGIHSVQDVGGGVRFGPDMEWIDDVNYTVDAGKQAQFETAIRAYWPDLPDGALQPDFAGIRPRIWGPGEAKREFEFSRPLDHGVSGLYHLFGFESPGLTSCLAIAKRLGNLLMEEEKS